MRCQLTKAWKEAEPPGGLDFGPLRPLADWRLLLSCSFISLIGRIQVLTSECVGMGFVILVCSMQAKKAGPRGGR